VEESSGEKISLLPKPAPPAVKKSAKKKPVKKAKKQEQNTDSEYKFAAVDRIPAYTFDKHTNPIIKEDKPKKKPAKKKSAAKKPAAKKPAPGIQEPPEGAETGQQPPPLQDDQAPPQDDQASPQEAGDQGGE
jgi:hypothetical protein